MQSNPNNVIVALDRRFLLDHVNQAALRIEKMPIEEAAATFAQHPATVLAPVLVPLATDAAVKIRPACPSQTRRNCSQNCRLTMQHAW